MARQEQIERISKLITLKAKVAQIRQEKLFEKQLQLIFRKYSGALIKELSNAGIFESIERSAGAFNTSFQINPVFQTDPVKEARTFATNELNRILRPLINLLNKENIYRDIIDKNNLKIYNIAGLSSAIITVFQLKAYSPNIKKAAEDELIQFDISISDDFSTASVGDTDIDFFLQNETLEQTIKARSQNINFVTDLDYKVITNTLVEEAYIKGSGSRIIQKQLESKLDNVSRYRSQLIARTELNIVQTEATMEFGRRVGMQLKRWLSMGDHLVRSQHIENELVGPVKFEETFSSTSEYSPGRCASPFQCRCSIIIFNDPKEDIVNSYWNGSQLVQVFI